MYFRDTVEDAVSTLSMFVVSTMRRPNSRFVVFLERHMRSQEKTSILILFKVVSADRS